MHTGSRREELTVVHTREAGGGITHRCAHPGRQEETILTVVHTREARRRLFSPLCTPREARRGPFSPLCTPREAREVYIHRCAHPGRLERYIHRCAPERLERGIYTVVHTWEAREVYTPPLCTPGRLERCIPTSVHHGRLERDIPTIVHPAVYPGLMSERGLPASQNSG